MSKEHLLAIPVPDISRELIRQCVAGDRVAQYRLYKLFARPMYNLCLRMVNDPVEAEDLLQEAFVKVFGEVRRFRGESTPGAWIRRIVINQCLNHLRKNKVVFETLDMADVADEPEKPGYPDIGPEEIRESIGALPEGARVVLALYLFEGFRHSDIASMLGISESTSKSQYRRALGLMRERIERR
jgi:RNA polymerase sigma-70 factor (ECF subfamily)